MKQIIKTIIIAPLFILFLIILNPNVAKTNVAAPPTGGLSGDPSRTSCALIGCHFGTSGATYTFGPGELTLNMGDTTTSFQPMSGQSYVPGKTYYIELRPNLANGPTPKYGFQMTSLDAAGNMSGAFTVVYTGRTAAESLLSRNYISHKNANSSSDWIFKWTAPATNSGPVTFYYACNMANGDNNTGGDSIFTGTTVLSPSTTSGIFSTDGSFEGLDIYPNPAKDFIMLSFQPSSDYEVKVSLYDLAGKMIQFQNYSIQQSGTNTVRHQLPATAAPGIYLLKLETANQIAVQRIAIM